MPKKFSLYLILFLISGFSISTFFMPSNQFASISETSGIYELKTEIKSELSIIFVGDMLFDRYIRSVINKKGEDFAFSCIDDLLKNADFAVGNLEGPITEYPSVSLGSEIGSPDNYVFTFPPETAHTLARNNFKVINIGNNHIGNFGWEGVRSTKEFLKKANVNFFGGLNGDESVYRMEVNGIRLSFVSYNEFGGSKPGDVAEVIKNETKEDRLVIVYTHWGDEYSREISRIKSFANLFAESGAKLIIGSHPHIVLPSEKIGEAIVYYSLGNFIFDQYFNKEVSNGLAVGVTISQDEISIEEYPVKMEKDGRTCLTSST